MRKLTQKEIDDAPSWAVSYTIITEIIGGGISYHERHYGFTLPLPHDKPQRKEFDIDAGFRKKIRRIALANGFKYKQQPDGSMDLNPYVFEFAKALLTAEDLK